jgi:hypothetical protein
MRTTLLASAAAVGLALAVPRAHAVEIQLGGLTPSPGCNQSSGADEGLICGSTETVKSGLDLFDVAAFSDKFQTPANLTFKPGPGNPLGPPNNSPGESGFGENALGATHCTDDASGNIHDCEIGGNAAVAISAKIGLIDAVVGSVQHGENFILYGGDSLATLAPIASGTGGSCTGTGEAGECLVTFSPEKFIGLQAGGSGDVLLTALSLQPDAVPEPTSFALLGVGLIGLGFAKRRLRLKN